MLFPAVECGRGGLHCCVFMFNGGALKIANDLVGLRRIDGGERVLVHDLLTADDEWVFASQFTFDLLQSFYLRLAVFFFAKIDERLVLKWRLCARCCTF